MSENVLSCLKDNKKEEKRKGEGEKDDWNEEMKSNQ